MRKYKIYFDTYKDIILKKKKKIRYVVIYTKESIFHEKILDLFWYIPRKAFSIIDLWIWTKKKNPRSKITSCKFGI